MGLIKAVLGAAGGTLADQWKEFFVCDSIPDSLLMVRGTKMITGRSSNTKGNDNVITNGSGIAVADGQCMIILENGRVVDVCAEPGKYTYRTDLSPSIFAPSDGIWNSIKATFKDIGQRLGYGGDPGKDQRVYYFNTKDIPGNLFGTPTPVPFRIVDSRLGLDLDAEVSCSGNYVFQMVDPLLFYTKLAGNAEGEYPKSKIESTLKADLIDSLMPAFGEISEMEIRPNQLVGPGKKDILRGAVEKALAEKWGTQKGFRLVDINITSLKIPQEYQDIIKEKQARASDIAMMSDPNAAGAALVGGQISAMNAAANNPNGAAMGLMGMGMTMNAGGMNAASMFAMGQQSQQTSQQTAPPQLQPTAAAEWVCACGASNTGKFCQECGKPKPEVNGWTCECGTVNKGKFCQECGKPKPAGARLYKCDKCGWEPEDPANPPKFCPNCGDIFDDNDAKS